MGHAGGHWGSLIRGWVPNGLPKKKIEIIKFRRMRRGDEELSP